MALSTINPLFVDSTKPIGDKVVTNVELTNILLHDGDSVYFEVMDHFGFSQRFALQSVSTKKAIHYVTEVWLKYQHQIQYRFVLVNEEKPLYVSAIRETRAGHVICEKWEPCFDQPLVTKTDKRISNRAEFSRDARAPREIKTSSSKPLCKPQFFDQIKSLLDDLL